jgi:hypothetical protein
MPMEKSAANRFGGPFIPEPLPGAKLPPDLLGKAEDVAEQCGYQIGKILQLAEQRYLDAIHDAELPEPRRTEPRYIAPALNFQVQQ